MLILRKIQADKGEFIFPQISLIYAEIQDPGLKMKFHTKSLYSNC